MFGYWIIAFINYQLWFISIEALTDIPLLKEHISSLDLMEVL